MWLKEEEEENLTPQIKLKFRSAEEVNFVSQYSSYFSRLKELGEEGLLTGYSFLCSFLLRIKCSVPIILIFMVCDSEFFIKRLQCSHGSGALLLAEHIPTPHPLR